MLISDKLSFQSARAGIEKYFRTIFGSNENFKICFRDYLTFRKSKKMRRRTQTTFFRFSCSFRQQLPLQLCGKLSSTIEVAPAPAQHLYTAAAAHASFLSIFFIIFLSLGFSLSTGRGVPAFRSGGSYRDSWNLSQVQTIWSSNLALFHRNTKLLGLGR